MKTTTVQIQCYSTSASMYVRLAIIERKEMPSIYAASHHMRDLVESTQDRLSQTSALDSRHGRSGLLNQCEYNIGRARQWKGREGSRVYALWRRTERAVPTSGEGLEGDLRVERLGAKSGIDHVIVVPHLDDPIAARRGMQMMRPRIQRAMRRSERSLDLEVPAPRVSWEGCGCARTIWLPLAERVR